MPDFLNLIKQNFQFLVDEYGYSITAESTATETKPGDRVLFQSQLVSLAVCVYAAEASLEIGPRGSPPENWLDFQDVIKYFAPEVDFASLSNEEINSIETPLGVELRVQNKVVLLRQYCQPLLSGDFSKQEEIREIEKKRHQAMKEYFQRQSDEKKKKASKN